MFGGSSEVSANLHVNEKIHATVRPKTTFQAMLSQILTASAVEHGSTSIDAFLRLYGEINVFAAAEIHGSTAFSADIEAAFDFYGAFRGSTQVNANLRTSSPAVSELSIIVDISPSALGAPGRYISGWVPRLKIDGVEIPITDWNYSEAPNTVGGDLSVTLLNPNDRSLFTLDSAVDFAIGRQVWSGSDIIWDEASMFVLMSSATVRDTALSIAFSDKSPTDSVSVKGSSALDDKLSITPSATEIFFDSLRQSLTLDNFEAVVDTEGQLYYHTLTPIVDMSLYDLFDKVFVHRCGFDAYKTNIPNYQINRVDCNLGQSYFEGIKGVFGMFEPVVFVVGNTIWIVDTTVVLPAGFPSPRQVKVDEYRSLSLENTRNRLDGLLVDYIEQALDYDYVTTREEDHTETVGSFGDPNYSITLVERLFREYRKFTAPAVVIRSELYREIRTTDGPGLVGEISSSTEDYTYDSVNRCTLRVKTEHARTPSLDDPDVFVNRLVREERETFTYASHPFQPRNMYIQRRELTVSGLIVVDHDNQQLGKDFEREFLTAYRSGNLATGMTTRFGAISSRVEVNEPLRGGSVRVTTKEIDSLAQTVVSDVREERSGDISINALGSRQKQVLVFDDENTTRGTSRIESVHMGEVPVSILVPLARRILRTKKKKGQTISCDVIGFDPILRRGMSINAIGRYDTDLGNFIILGRRIRGDQTGCEVNLTCKEI
jgi:hypothetical protein